MTAPLIEFAVRHFRGLLKAWQRGDRHAIAGGEARAYVSGRPSGSVTTQRFRA